MTTDIEKAIATNAENAKKQIAVTRQTSTVNCQCCGNEVPFIQTVVGSFKRLLKEHGKKSRGNVRVCLNCITNNEKGA